MESFNPYEKMIIFYDIHLTFNFYTIIKPTIATVIFTELPYNPKFMSALHCLINEQECFIMFKVALDLSKTRPSSLLNGFKHEYKVNKLPSISILYIKNTNEDTTTIDTALLVFFI